MIPQSDDKGTLYVGHEDRMFDRLIGDGGGGTLFDVERSEGKWNVTSPFRAVDFSPVGGTINNCGGSLTPMGTILTAEEWDADNNEKLNNSGQWITDTTEYLGRSKWKNFGWMVEVDPESGKAMNKLWQMGRYAHEDAIVMPDKKTVYLTDDNSPAVWFKFIADTAGDLTEGQLYAYNDGNGKKPYWIKMPMDFESMVNAREVAVSLGASLFNRLEWVEGVGSKLYITETGRDETKWKKYMIMGGVPAMHMDEYKTDKKGRYSDPYGRVLLFDTDTDEMSVYINGGIDTKKGISFSNPDGLTQVTWNGRTYLVVHEDIIETSLGRSGNPASNTDEVYNEIFFIDLAIKEPSLNDLNRLYVAPRGCETTGGYFSPDGSSFFVNIQDPDKTNPEPFNRSHTVVITGFSKLIQ
jgi:secreted PhoX family phosphatase